jgi:hypothetical protein
MERSKDKRREAEAKIMEAKEKRRMQLACVVL